MEWISVKEHGKPQEFNIAYFVLDALSGNLNIFYLGKDGTWFDSDEVEFDDATVSHYIKVPDLPII